MPGHQLGHLEHGDALLAVEDGLQRVVGIDHRPLFRVLQAVLADVYPELLGQLRAWERFFTDHLGELLVRGDRFHEC